MKLLFLLILFSLVITSGLVSVEAQSEPPPSECTDMPKETLEEKIEKKECKVEEAQSRIDAATVNAEKLFWIEKLEIRQAALDRLLKQQLEASEIIISDFDLSSDNNRSTGITAYDGKFWVVDDRDDKVYAYNADGTRDAASDFDLDADNYRPGGITALDGKFWVVDSVDAKVYVYNADGTPDAASEFNLHADNDWPWGITAYDNKFWVLDEAEGKIFVYNQDGTRDAASDFNLASNSGTPLGITAYDGKFWVTDDRDDKVYAYNADGTRDAASDFDLDSNTSFATGITAHDDKLWVVDYTDDKVYAYDIDETSVWSVPVITEPVTPTPTPTPTPEPPVTLEPTTTPQDLLDIIDEINNLQTTINELRKRLLSLMVVVQEPITYTAPEEMPIINTAEPYAVTNGTSFKIGDTIRVSGLIPTLPEPIINIHGETMSLSLQFSAGVRSPDHPSKDIFLSCGYFNFDLDSNNVVGTNFGQNCVAKNNFTINQDETFHYDYELTTENVDYYGLYYINTSCSLRTSHYDWSPCYLLTNEFLIAPDPITP